MTINKVRQLVNEKANILKRLEEDGVPLDVQKEYSLARQYVGAIREHLDKYNLTENVDCLIYMFCRLEAATTKIMVLTRLSEDHEKGGSCCGKHNR